MTIRFLQTCPSESPAYPFQAGQVIVVPAPSRYLLSLLDGIRAEAMKTDPTERAVTDDPEIPEVQPVFKRGRRARV
jgi:hypothetical protein